MNIDNLDDAVEILNRERFGGVDSWGVGTDYDGDDAVLGSSWVMTPFVAIAVAEKLERDAGRDMPATRRLMAHFKSLFGERCRAVNGPDSHWFHNSDGKTLTLGEIDAAVAEWEGKP